MITEIHVKSATMLNERVPVKLRGKYLGLCSEPMLKFFRKTGINKLQIMPVWEFADEPELAEKGLVNYWGYNPVSFTKASTRYAVNPEKADSECKEMIQTLRDNGIDVILDVVLNHVDSTVREDYHQWGRNYSGCGDTVKTHLCIDPIMQALIHWYKDMGASGFRFDLATSVFRDGDGAFNNNCELINRIRDDKDLSGAILIAESWDLDTYQLGHVLGFSECMDIYRDQMRDFWKGTGSTEDFARNITGNQEMFAGRWCDAPPVNYITYHDGFTLLDLVSYNDKQNMANGEDNADGTSNNRSWDRYLEWDTEEMTNDRRDLARRNMMTTLLFSLGEPHICFHDLFSHSTGGNNNVYCQDNELNYIDWTVIKGSRKEAFFRFMFHTIHLSNDVMPALNKVVGTELAYDWTKWKAGENEFTMTAKGVELTYRIRDGEMKVTKS